MFFKLSKKFIYTVLILGLIFTFSCRKDKAFVIKKNKATSEEEIKILKSIETRLLIWRNKKNFSTLKKYLDAKEQYIKFSKKELKDRLFLAEHYCYLSFITKDKKEKIYALKKGVLNSKIVLEKTSKAYKSESEKFTQDYQSISSVNKKEFKALYWYINNNVLLRKETNNLILYKDDLIASLKHYYSISPNKEKIFSEAILFRYLPIIGGKDEKKADEILNTLNDNQKFLLLIKILFIKNDKDKNIKLLKKSLNFKILKNQIFLESLKLIFAQKK